MVDTAVIKEQFQQAKKLGSLSGDTEKRIARLLKYSQTITQKQANIIMRIIDAAIRGYSKSLTLEELNILSTVNIFNTTDAQKLLLDYQDNIGRMYNMGIKFTSDTPSGIVNQLQQSVIQSSMQYITKLGDTYKMQIGQIIGDGLKREMNANDIATNIQKYLENQKWQADRIVRTETMRAAHNGSYAQARREGKQFFVIDGRAEFCKYCRKISAMGPFGIDEVKYLPPLHPNCACIPVYYNTEEEAKRDHDYLQSEIAKQRAAIEKKGWTIKQDGTGIKKGNKEKEKAYHEPKGPKPKRYQNPDDAFKNDKQSKKPQKKQPKTVPKPEPKAKSKPEPKKQAEYKLEESNKLTANYLQKKGNKGRLTQGNFTEYTYSNGKDNVSVMVRDRSGKVFTHKDVIDVYKQMPIQLRRNTDRIFVLGRSTRTYGYHAGHPEHGKDIYLFQHKDMTIDDHLPHTIPHEAGHALGYNEGINDTWRLVADYDNNRGNGFVSRYVESYRQGSYTRVKEDFADSCALWMADAKQFAKDCPQRARSLDKLFKGDSNGII